MTACLLSRSTRTAEAPSVRGCSIGFIVRLPFYSHGSPSGYQPSDERDDAVGCPFQPMNRGTRTATRTCACISAKIVCRIVDRTQVRDRPCARPGQAFSRYGAAETCGIPLLRRLCVRRRNDFVDKGLCFRSQQGQLDSHNQCGNIAVKLLPCKLELCLRVAISRCGRVLVCYSVIR